MSIKTIREVIGETLSAQMRRDSDILLMGEDVAGGAGCSGAVSYTHLTLPTKA